MHGYFRETHVGCVRPGNPAVITLMTYPDRPLRAVVDSIGQGIHQSDGSVGPDLLPNVSPTLQWIHLAQRVPVPVHLEEVPEAVELRVGVTASALVLTGSVGGEYGGPAGADGPAVGFAPGKDRPGSTESGAWSARRFTPFRTSTCPWQNTINDESKQKEESVVAAPIDRV